MAASPPTSESQQHRVFWGGGAHFLLSCFLFYIEMTKLKGTNTEAGFVAGHNVGCLFNLLWFLGDKNGKSS
jgi:hypothetical protein